MEAGALGLFELTDASSTRIDVRGPLRRVLRELSV